MPAAAASMTGSHTRRRHAGSLSIKDAGISCSCLNTSAMSIGVIAGTIIILSMALAGAALDENRYRLLRFATIS
jgi:hypothetical protein